jgi:4a-hydroxytetrahydrobiopterin dehydratase
MPQRRPLDDERIRVALASMPGWRLEGNALAKAWRFHDFRTALAFMHDCIEDIERLAHHPEWTNVYDRVSARLTTHDAGNRVTDLDVALAKILDWKAASSGATGSD